MYYDFKNRQLPAHQRGGTIDLRFATMMNDLDLPLRDAHDALNDAVMAGLAYLKLRSLLASRRPDASADPVFRCWFQAHVDFSISRHRLGLRQRISLNRQNTAATGIPGRRQRRKSRPRR